MAHFLNGERCPLTPHTEDKGDFRFVPGTTANSRSQREGRLLLSSFPFVESQCLEQTHVSSAGRNQLTPSQVYQLRELDQICVFPNPFKHVGKRSVLISLWHSPRLVMPNLRELSAEPHPASVPCSQCWRASGKLAQTEHWRQLGSVRLKASANKPCQGKFSAAEPCGTFLLISLVPLPKMT